MPRLRLNFNLLSVLLILRGQTTVASQPRTKWGYVDVREGAHMFWLLELCRNCDHLANKSKPLIIWLQGGPGASGVGYGNFEEIGPYGLHWKPRKHSWAEVADVLFIDNPVGTGFSYVDDEALYTKDNLEIATDLVAFMRGFLKESHVSAAAPIFIFCESYGGKMGLDFAKLLLDAQKDGTIESNLRGLALGDSWVSPIDFVSSWGPVLYAWSLIDDNALANLTHLAQQTKAALEGGNGTLSTHYWALVEQEVARQTDNVDFYNMLQHNVPDDSISANSWVQMNAGDLPSAAQRHLLRQHPDPLDKFMNTAFRRHVKIIPDNVTWGGQAGQVFKHLSEDFMKDAIPTFDQLMQQGFPITLYSGQMDLICCTLGLDVWLEKSKWNGLEGFQQAARQPLHTNGHPSRTAGFVKSSENLKLYYIMGAGHMVPADQPKTALTMVQQIIEAARNHGELVEPA